MNPLLKRYLISSGITFLTVFLTALSLEMGNWTAETLTSGVFVSAMLTAVRAGIKGIAELLPTIK
jgi:hypothetical protein